MRLAIHDAEWLPSLHQGTPAAFESAYRSFHRSLLYFVFQLTHDKEVAEDITIETFAKAFTRHKDFSTLKNFKAFLFTAANNAALDFLKQDKRQKEIRAELEGSGYDEMDNAELMFIRAEAIKSIHDAIAAIPGKPRQVIYMAFVEGKKLPEIAAELNLSYNTVQNHRAKGLELVKMQLIKNKLVNINVFMLAMTFLDQQ